jgi:membrane-bound metal-dependent hydrolase YbcI (DUF457 family)
MPPAKNYPAGGRASWLISLGNYVDVRLLLVGSLLPDIVDKPLGMFFLRDTFGNGRIFCHTLVFALLITLAGFYIYRRHGKMWLLILAFGTFTHLLLDEMWLEPRTLLWPLYGYIFPRGDPTDWIWNILYALRTDPGEYIPEIVGAAILVWFVVVLVRRKTVGAFIKSGKLHDS